MPWFTPSDWLNIRDRNDTAALDNYFLGIYGDPIDIASGKIDVLTKEPIGKRFAELLDKARQLLDEETLLQLASGFPRRVVKVGKAPDCTGASTR